MKILILTCNTGQGHNSTAKSVAEKFAERNVQCDIEDALSFVSPKMSEFISSWHVRIYRNAPVLFDQGYEFAEKHPSVLGDDSVILNFFRLGVKKLEKHIREGGYDGVICVHVFSALMVTEVQKTSEHKFVSAFIATDYTCSPGVAESNLDAYFIPHSRLFGEFVACGVPEEKIIASGIPVKETFYHSVDKKQAKRELGIDENKKHILMMCGSMGCGPMENLAEEIKEIIPENALLTVVCGTNEKLKKKLAALESENVHVLGFVENVSLLMDSADLYMTKPGGLSITEAAAKKLPLAFIDAVSGCEGYNRYFFLTLGIAIASNDAQRLPRMCLNRVFNDAELEKQREIMEREFSHSPADIICDYFIGEPK